MPGDPREDEVQATGGLLNPAEDDFALAADRRWDSAEEHAVDVLADMSENELHAGVGQICPRCGRTIEAGQAVRLMVSGNYQHDVCPI